MTSISCSRSSLSRTLLALAWLVIFGVPSVRASDVARDVDHAVSGVGVRIVGLSSKDVEPGSFASLVVEVENPTLEARTVTLDLLPPPGWTVVSSARTVRVDALGQRSVPFTVAVPERATDDERHEFMLVLTSPEGTPSFRLPHAVRVAPRPAVALHTIRSEPRPLSGERSRHTLSIENTGNVSNLYALTVESTPAWRTSIEPSTVFLRPGEGANVLVEVDVPRRAIPGTLNHLLVIATGSELGLHGAAEARVPLSSVVAVRPRSPARFQRLPLEVTTSAGRNRRDEPTYAVRLLSDGQVGEDRRLLLESDFRSEGPADSRALELRRSRARLAGATWEVAFGDVWTEMADAVSPSVAGRGGRAVKESERWAAEGFLHVAKDDRRLSTPTWGATSSRELRPGLWVDGGFLTRQADAFNESAGDPRGSFLTLGTRWTATPRLELRSEAAWSREVVNDLARIGRAGELQADYRGETFQAKARGYAGQPKFAGRIRNEQGFVAHARRAVATDMVLWTNLDVVRNSAQLVRNVRLAGRFGDPGTEITLDSRLDRAATLGGAPHARTELLTVWSWREMGPVRLGVSGNAGWKRDERTERNGLLWGGATEVVGRVGDVRASVSLDRSSEYAWGASEDFTSLGGDVSWVPARRPVSLGLAFRSHAVDSRAGSIDTEHSLRPRAEWRLGAATRFQVDAAFERVDRDFGLKEWRFQVVWSGEEALPLLWNPRDAHRRGRVFLDVDLDGRFGPRDVPLAGVRLGVDGQPRVSGDRGEFEFPAAIGSSYRLELKAGSVPPDLVAAGVFPCEVPAIAERFFDIPLVRGGSVTGRVFRDEDRNGREDPEEPGMADIRMEILRGGLRVATNLTDAAGDYSFGMLPPGDYTLRVASDWMPPGWEATGRPVAVRVAPAGSTRAEPVGLAAHRKPIRKTFDGTSRAR